MTNERVRGFCPRCRHQQIFEKSRLHHGVHFLLSVLTCGLWLVSWVSIYIGHRFRPWRCVQCGWPKPQFTENLCDHGAATMEANAEKKAGDSISTV
jgi:hypothetical protein